MSKQKHSLTVAVLEPGGERTIRVVGQFARTLDALIAAGQAGTTSLEVSTWALRLSHYIFVLRKDHGLLIEMKREPHATGEHGRYFLRSEVRVIDRDFATARKRAVA